VKFVKMSASTKLILKSFPNINNDISEYVESVLETSVDEFENVDDVYEAIGEVLQEVEVDKSEEDIRDICKKLLDILKPDLDKKKTTNGGLHRMLNAPVHLVELVSENTAEDVNDPNSIWMKNADDVNRNVDTKKVERAEELAKKKQEKRDMKDSKPVNNFRQVEATASQVISKKENRAEASGNNNSRDIHIENFDICYGEKVLIQGADVTLAFGRRYGFVGRNGLGKTTVLKMISTKQLFIPSHITVLHVEQEVVGDDTRAIDSVLESDTTRLNLLAEEKELQRRLNENDDPTGDAGSRLNAVYIELETIEAAKAPARAAVILDGLGFTPEMQGRATKTFSGGWRMRIALARALFSKPDLLLLDEPTNMLDMQAIIWLERYMQTWQSTALVVSHDRNFLDEICTDILHLNSQKITVYRGNYSEFYNTMVEKLKTQQREYESQMEYRKHVQEFIDKFRFNAKRASMVQSRIKMLEKLPKLEAVIVEGTVTLKFPEVDKLQPPIMVLSQVDFKYEGTDRTIFKDVDLSATMESRICIVGENGAGKSTLLKIIMDKLTPTSGTRNVHRNLKFGYFTQHFVDQLDLSVCPIELMAKEFPGMKGEEYRRMLGKFGISGDLALQQTETLSGGQKSRVAFSILCAHNPNFLILDEPTNHLDIETIEALGHALIKYKGGVVLVSHDERLLKMVCQELWVCSKGKVYSLEGGLDSYRKMVEIEMQV